MFFMFFFCNMKSRSSRGIPFYPLRLSDAVAWLSAFCDATRPEASPPGDYYIDFTFTARVSPLDQVRQDRRPYTSPPPPPPPPPKTLPQKAPDNKDEGALAAPPARHPRWNNWRFSNPPPPNVYLHTHEYNGFFHPYIFTLKKKLLLISK